MLAICPNPDGIPSGPNAGGCFTGEWKQWKLRTKEKYPSRKGVRAECTKVEDASSFEVAIIDENLPDDQQQWDVNGWQTREDINKLIKENS